MIRNWKQLSELTVADGASGECQDQQHSWLLSCLEENKHTEYGRRHNFAHITSIDEFRSFVPLVHYEDISSYMDRIAMGEGNVLFRGRAIAFEKTSGSSGNSKLIPYSKSSLRDFRRGILPWLSELTQHYKIDDGTAYWAISPATRQQEFTRGGVPIGMPDAAYLGEELLPFFATSSAVPPWVGEVSNIEQWQLLTLYYLVRDRDMVLISVWSPTFLLLLLDAIVHLQTQLMDLLLQGGEVATHSLSAAPQAARRLQSYLNTHQCKQLWPDLKIISCWADASSRPYYQALQERFPGVAFQAKGLLSTEAVVTVPNGNNQPLLTCNSGFYEFLTEEGHSLLAHELVQGKQYECVVTTAGGLYRYRSGDLVCYEGLVEGRPVLRFIGRGDLSSDLVGEKLHEAFVADCLHDIAGFRMLMPRRNGRPGYLLLLDRTQHHNVDELVQRVEQRLSTNPHYAYARKLGQLDGLQVQLLDEPLTAYINSPLHGDARLGDIKVPALCNNTAWLDKELESVA